MRLLLDTHALLWALAEPRELATSARDAIEDGRNEVLVSAVSAWEIAIKRTLGRLDAPEELVGAMHEAAFAPLAITVEHALVAGVLPLHHRDPFDRMLVAQAIVEGLTIVTRDTRFSSYGVPLLQA